MNLKVNNGHSFLHPKSGVMIGPGQFYEDYEEVVESQIATSSKRSKKDVADKTATTDDSSDSTPVVTPEGDTQDGSNQPAEPTQG